jgi:hypothetical protein
MLTADQLQDLIDAYDLWWRELGNEVLRRARIVTLLAKSACYLHAPPGPVQKRHDPGGSET